jgi:serine/threonine protein phosphatase PrpC
MGVPVIPSGETIVQRCEVEPMNEGDRHTSLTVRSFGLTDTGRVREINQDQFLIAVLRKALQIQRTSLPTPKVRYGSDQSHLFIVADGMGGHAGGETASALAIDSVDAFVLDTIQWFTHFKGTEESKLLADFQRALGDANARLLSEAVGRPELQGMGTTLTLAYSLNDRLFVAHVGDSRCYLYRNKLLYRLTTDHTLVEEMVRRGVLKQEEAGQHQWRTRHHERCRREFP